MLFAISMIPIPPRAQYHVKPELRLTSFDLRLAIMIIFFFFFFLSYF